jgi:hypothetical protein
MLTAGICLCITVIVIINAGGDTAIDTAEPTVGEKVSLAAGGLVAGKRLFGLTARRPDSSSKYTYASA